MLPDRIADALAGVCAALVSCPATWLVTGSVAAALHRLPVVPNDLDIETDAAGAYDVQRRLGGQVVRPVGYSATDRVRSHFGITCWAGIAVEIMGDLQIKLAGDGWLVSRPVVERRAWVTYDRTRVPVISALALARFYRDLGRPEQAELVCRGLGSEGLDSRGLDFRELG